MREMSEVRASNGRPVRSPSAAATRRRTPATKRPPSVSVVLPVLNEERDIGRLLDELLHQIPPPDGFEILVADGGSTDRTRDIVVARSREWPNLRLVENPGRLSSAGRNAGARAARGEYVLFLDGHCSVPRRDYLVRLVEIFRASGAACLCRPQPLQRLAESRWAQAIAAARHSFLGHDPGSDIYGGEPAYTDPRSAGAAYARAVFDQLGGYDERFDACEDVEFNLRVAGLGVRSYRHPDLAIDYRPRRTLGAFYRQMNRYGRGRARLMARHPGAAPWSLLAATVLAIAWIATMPLLGWRVAAVAGAALISIWSVLVLVESLRVSRGSRGSARIAASLAAIHSGLLLGFWRGLAEFRRYRRPGLSAVEPDRPEIRG